MPKQLKMNTEPPLLVRNIKKVLKELCSTDKKDTTKTTKKAVKKKK